MTTYQGILTVPVNASGIPIVGGAAPSTWPGVPVVLLDASGNLIASLNPNFISAPGGWNTQWLAAKAASATATANIWVYGDSTSQGTSQLSDVLVDVWLRKVLNSLPNNPWNGGLLGGDFFSFAYSQDVWTAQAAGTIPGVGQPLYSAFQATGKNSFNGPLGAHYWWASTAQGLDLVTFTTPYACTDIDIISLDYVTGSFDYKVDGGSAVTVTINPGSSTTTVPRRTQITGLANTTHTVLITNPQGAVNAAFMGLGMVCYKSRAAGILTAWSAKTGTTLTAGVRSAFPATNPHKLMQGYTTTAQNNTGFGFPMQPDLAIVNIGINDLQNYNYQGDGFRHGLRKLIQAVRRGTQNASVLLVAASNPDSQTSDMTSGWFTNSDYWRVYINAMSDVAIEYNCALVNIHAKWSERAVTLGYQLSASNAHPSANGHTDIANTILGGI